MSPFRNRSGPQEDNQQEVPKLLLNEATRQFAERGYDGVTVRDIAGAAGVNLALIGYYFGGKEGLYRACLDGIGELQLERLPTRLENMQSQEDFRGCFHELVLRTFSYYLEHPHAVRLLIREFMDHAHEAEVEAERPRAKVMPFQFITQFIRSAQERGLVRQDLQAPRAASMIAGMLTYLMMVDPYKERVTGLTMKESAHRHELAAHLVSLVCDGCLEPPN